MSVCMFITKEQRKTKRKSEERKCLDKLFFRLDKKNKKKKNSEYICDLI